MPPDDLPFAGNPQALSLREALRHKLRPQHDALDAKVTTFNLASYAGLVAFLRMQSHCLGVIASRVETPESAAMINDLHRRSVDDLDNLDAPFSLASAHYALPETLNQTAIDYVICGSRLGTVVLKRRWEASGDARVRAARQYFSAPDYIERWKAFVARARLPMTGNASERQVIADTRALFELYLDAAETSGRQS